MDGSRGTDLTTLLVGIDAGCQSVVEPLFEAGDLPNLRSVFRGGVGGPLESQIPPWTASAWPSMYTGKNPGKHGIFGFLHFDGYEEDVVNATRVREPSLWELLDHHGLTSVVVNVPVTSPPKSFDGALVPGYVAPENPPCHPEGLLEDVRDELGEYRVYADVDETKDEATYRSLVRSRGEAFRYLADRFDPDFGFVEFQQTDSVFHEHPGDEELVRAVYRAVDEQVGQILDACDPDNVVVASDHGMGPYDRYEFRVNEFLRDEGYVEATQGGEGMPSWVKIRENRLHGGSEEEPAAGDDEDGRSPLEVAVSTAARFGLTTERVATALRKVGLDSVVARVVPEGVQSAGMSHVSFPESKAYMRDLIELGVRINLEGREPEGTVPQERYEDVRDELIEALSSVRTPDGDPVFEDVARREKYFYGPEAENAVDVVTVPSNFDHYLSAQLYGEQFGDPTEPWNHKRFGIVAARGEAVDESAGVRGAHLFDVAPTVLATFGLPADVRMDGDPLDAVEAAGETEYPDFDSRETVETDDDAVEKRLSDLGYLDN
ncbi:alkaline phosphatase family protein [Halopelagius longus]|uniref:Phosphodiesterase n=1 Tax=Halopelagius longus TaxID=1236180 RepID=A0A1H1GJT9_9EURY|nr:alkaline phosphatase family protein [Halopelagius longus]RDI69713.1 phosphodiesterase [Halopelagius longus]SDR13148.1 Predicted phosphohydrolase or phosphomutase, AlkP superfamily [Halopelagius longus]